MASKIRTLAGSNVLQYIVNVADGKATLTPDRGWASSDARIVTALGAQTLARLAIANGASLQSTYILRDGLETPEIVVNARFLKLSNIAFRIADDGAAMTVRKTAQKDTARFEKRAARFVKADKRRLASFGLKFGN